MSDDTKGMSGAIVIVVLIGVGLTVFAFTQSARDKAEVMPANTNVPPFRGRIELEGCPACGEEQQWTTDYSARCEDCGVTQFFPHAVY